MKDLVDKSIGIVTRIEETLARIKLRKVIVFQVSMSVGFSPGSITIISCAKTEGWSVTSQGRGFKSCSIVAWKVFGV